MSDKIKKVIVEYIWIDGNEGLRSKTKVLSVTEDEYNDVLNIKLPDWNYDGSSCGQKLGLDTEVVIKPQRICKCPFRRNGNNIMVMCDTYNADGTPHDTNTRINAKQIFNQKVEEDPWFGLEQEFFFFDAKTDTPIGFNGEVKEIPHEQGIYYCSVGAKNTFGRHIMEEALDNMLYAELGITGINEEVALGSQWEYQVFAEGIDASDQMWISRYILERTAEKYNVWINYHPKPLPDVNGSGCHINVSTKTIRESNELDEIIKAIKKLEPKHIEHMDVYGKYNEMRMSGHHETSSYNKFSYGIGTRNTSIRIGNDIKNGKNKYFEDRRPSSCIDPYLGTSKLFETICL